MATYRPLLERPDRPIAVADVRWLFYEPYYQLMRQTLLAWQMVEHQEFGATDWLHVHVVPLGNARLRARGGAPRQLPGRGLAEVWRSVLRQPSRYRLITPTELITGLEAVPAWAAWRNWLRDRYLT